jgi:hypothetical protein
LQAEPSAAVDVTARRFFYAAAIAVEIEQRSREPHAIAVDGEANRHAQYISGRGQLVATVCA